MSEANGNGMWFFGSGSGSGSGSGPVKILHSFVSATTLI